MKFSQYLAKRRRELGLTQQNIADELGISGKAVSKWETGESFPETAQLVPLSEILGCSVDDMLRGREPGKEGEPLSAPCAAEEPDDRQAEDTSDPQGGKKADEGKKEGIIEALLMPVCALVYVAIGLIFHVWHPTWLLFIFGAIACAALETARKKK